jgi:uncharacterized protein
VVLDVGLQKKLLKISREALEYYFKTGTRIVFDEQEIDAKLKVNRATFVTLKKNGNLRGCVGKLEAIQSIYLDVVENTYLAAFADSRFPALSVFELDEIKIEISVLEVPKVLEYDNSEGLLKVLDEKRSGIILRSGYNQATFLPQVWEEIREPDEFLSHLCQKAGLAPNFWILNKLQVRTYQVEKFCEE